jgi:tetratricopeptide (TPR) repeat protein
MYRGDLDAAERACRQALALRPDAPIATGNLGAILYRKGELDEALVACRAAVRLTPDFPLWRSNLGLTLRAAGDCTGARAELAEAARLLPTDAAVLNDLAWLLATAPDGAARDGRQAVELATRACELGGWRVGAHIDTLAAAHAEAGQFARAREYEAKAVAVAGYDAVSFAVAAHRLALFHRGRPYRTGARPLAPPPRPLWRRPAAAE